MCDGDGGGGSGGATGRGDAGEGEHGSGGNVGPGLGPGGSLPTTRNDPPPVASAPAPAATGSGGGSWEEATTLVGEDKSDPALGNMLSGEGAFGFTPAQGLQGGMLAGLGIPGLSLATMIGGYLMGHAPGGNVGDYGGGDPDAGGGPSDPYAPKIKPTGGGGGDDEGFISTMLGGGGSAGGGEDGSTTEDDRGFGLQLSPEPSDRSKRYKRNVGDSELLKTLIFDENEFTKSLF